MGDNPAMTPPFQKCGQGNARFFKNVKSHIIKYGNLGRWKCLLILYGWSGKCGEAFEVVLLCWLSKAWWGECERRGGGALYTRDLPGYVDSEGQTT